MVVEATDFAQCVHGFPVPQFKAVSKVLFWKYWRYCVMIKRNYVLFLSQQNTSNYLFIDLYDFKLAQDFTVQCVENEIHFKMEMDSFNIPDWTILWSCCYLTRLLPPH